MTPEELRRCRAVRDGLKLRLRQLKTRLHGLVLQEDVLGLGTNLQMTMRQDSDKIAGFTRCIDTAVAQTFDQWMRGTCEAEVDAITGPMKTVVNWIAEDCIARRKSPADAWRALDAAFDGATKKKIAGFAFRVGTQRDLAERA